MELSIILPAWNEAENLPPLVKELRAALEGVTQSYEIVVVDGGSRDGTADVARGLGCKVHVQTTPGYGGALREGFAAAEGAFLCTLDADLSHPPTFIAEMWRRRHEADLIIASRYVPGGTADMPRSRLILSQILNRFFGELLAIPVGDLSSGFRLYRREALARFQTSGRNFNVLQELLTGVLARDGRIIEVPFHYRPRIFGVSHARIIRFGISYLGSLWHLFFLRTSLFRADKATRLFPYLLAIVFAVFIAYATALGNGAVHWDDDYLVFDNPALRSLDGASIAAMFDPTGSRASYGAQYEPLADLSYAVDGAIFGWRDPRPFHLQGILWHALAACLLFVLANRHTRSAGIAIVAALLFAVHPVATESVVWISGRRTAISAALLLLAALCWLRYRRTGGTLAYAGSLVAMLASCLSKQNGLATPLVLALLDVTAQPDGSAARLRRLLPLAPHFALAAALAAVFYNVGAREAIVGAHPLGLEGQVQGALIALSYYSRLVFVPVGLRPSYALLFPTSGLVADVPGLGLRLGLAGHLISGAAAALALVGGAALLHRRAAASPPPPTLPSLPGAAAFGLAAALLCLLPSLTGLGPQTVAERYLYLPLAFLAVSFAAGFGRLARIGPPPAEIEAERAVVRRRRRLTAGLLALLAALGFLTHHRSREWRDDVSLWTAAAAVEPENRVARRLLGEALLRRPSLPARLFPAAFGALARRPSDDDLARAHDELRIAALLEEHGGAPMRGPSPLPAVLADLALVAEMRGDVAGAEDALKRAIKAAPGSERAWVELGDFYLRQGEPAKARAVYAACVDSMPAASVARARLNGLR